MVGRPVLLRVDKQPHAPGPTVLDVAGLWVLSDLRTPAVEDLSLQVRAGEIVGIAGVQGNGQTELIEALSGLRQPSAGRIWLEGRDVTNASAAQLIRAGVGHVPEDRLRHGLVLTYTVADNTVLRTYDHPPFARGIAIVRQAIVSFAQRLVKEFDIRVRSVNSVARTLSGGNQQKVVARP